MRTRTVIVVGGGIAGLASAVRLIQHGLKPIVLEKRPFLGGRAYSFKDQETGIEIDNGQHVFVGACKQFQKYITDIGVDDQVTLDERLAFPVIKREQISWIRARKLPSILSNLSMLLGYRHIGISGKIRILSGLLSIKRTSLEIQHDQVTFYDWLKVHHQNKETIENFWNLIILPSLNDNINSVSAYTGISLFKVALLGPTQNAAMGFPLTGLSSLVGESARNFIEGEGGVIRPGFSVGSLHMESGQVIGVRTQDGELVEGDAVISALPAAEMTSLLNDSMDVQHDFFKPAESVQTAPIVAIHIWYDRLVLSEKYTAVLGSPLQWIFNDTRLKSRNDCGGQHVVISLSGAWEWQDRSKEELREIFTTEMARIFPEARTATITRFTVVKMLEATFRVSIGSLESRLPQRTPLPGFYLAGDWTDTGWPSTMESAVRSGNLAADCVAQDLINA